jgi:hypothetical protein
MIDRFGHVLATWLLPVNAWTAALLAAALLVDRALARRVRASLRIALYVPVVLRVVVPFSWSAYVPRAAVIMPLDALSAAPAAIGSGGTWQQILAVTYLTVAALLAAHALVRRRGLASALASARPVHGLDAPCPVLAHEDRGPMVVGLLTPRIVLPEAMLGGGQASTFSYVLGHESAHVRRRDPWLSAALEALRVVAWPVGPLGFASARVRHLVELACDEDALAGADAAARRRYGHLLLDVADQGSLAFAGGALHFGSTLRARIEAITLARPWPRVVELCLVGTAVAAFVACSAAGTGASQANDGARTSTTGVDEYGYQYDTDAVGKNAPRSTAPANVRNPDGRLAPEVIQGVVRQHFGEFRSCYEQALTKNPKLAGTVSVKYVINPDGTVRDAADGGSEMADQGVVDCVIKGFAALTYPPPQGGYVTVVYPVHFTPDGSNPEPRP